MKKTRMLTIRTVLISVFIWLLAVDNTFGVEPSWTGKRKLNGEATGIIRDIKEHNGAVFIGAENGLFRIVGNSTQQFTHSNSPLGKGYIADLHIAGNKLFISEFGNGVFTYSFSEGTFSKLTLPEHLAVKAWATQSYKNSVVVSTLSGLMLLPPSGDSPIIKDKFEDGSGMRSIYSLTVYNNLVAASEANHVIFMDEQLREITLLKRDIHFPGLAKITYVKAIGGYLYVGGVGGIYRYRDNVSDFYPVSVPENQLKDVESIIEDSEGTLWVAAGGLFTLDKSDGVLRELAFGKPRFSF
ncbi:MAG: hypothetical protein GY738_15530, partial [Pseudoalteromonas sp.]|nr:hypothetical protein [Pseudoalteromonas sp.]